MAYLSVVVFIVALVSGGLAYVADSAQPGDAMYPYKIAVVEQLEKTLAYSDAAKVQFHLSAMQEKLDEAQSLAMHGRFDAQAQGEVTDAITSHVRDLSAILDELHTRGADGEAATSAAQLYATLEGEAAQVSDTAAQGGNNLQVSLAPVLTTLRTTLATVSLISTKYQALAALSKPIGPATTPITASAESGR